MVTLAPKDSIEFRYAEALAQAEFEASRIIAGQRQAPFVSFSLEEFLAKPKAHLCFKCKAPGYIFIQNLDASVEIAKAASKLCGNDRLVMCRMCANQYNSDLIESRLRNGRSVDWGAVAFGEYQRF